MALVVRRESPEDEREISEVTEAWLALPLPAYDPRIRGHVVYPPFFPGPPNA